MLHTRNASYAVVALAMSAMLAGCSSSSEGPSFPPPPSDNFTAQFSLTSNFIPYPWDALFAGSTDGTLNIPAGLINPDFNRVAINALDGFSTLAEIRTRFNSTIDTSSLTGSSVRIVELYLDNATKAPATGAALPPGVASPVRRVLTPGNDYVADVAPEPDSSGRYLRIRPTVPLKPSTGGINTGYLVILTNGIRDITGRTAQPDLDFAEARNTTSCATISNATLRQLCPLIKAHLGIAQAIGTDPSTVVLAWSFSTQSTEDSFRFLNLLVGPQSIAVQATGLTTSALPGGRGIANIYVGATGMPYYLAVPATVNDRSVLTSTWTAVGPPPPPLDPTSRHITRFNPVPLQRAVLQIPVIVTAPNAGANNGAGCVKPAAGWPLMIVQHGITRSRLDAFAMADSLANACFIMAAMDLPMHGITDTRNPFYQAARERTFNLDLVNNSNTSSAVPDGQIDPSGTHAVPVALSSPLTARDLIRQGDVDIGVFAKSLQALDISGDGVPDVDPNRISFTGLSLGAIGGAVSTRFSPVIRTSTLSAGGGMIAYILRDSPAFSPSVSAGLNAAGLAPGSTLYNFFFRDLQTVLDPGDPANHIYEAQLTHAVHVQNIINDTVVQDSAQDKLALAGRLRRLTAAGTFPVGPGTGTYAQFVPPASHGSLFDPTTSLAATTEMQSEAIFFAATTIAPGGPFVRITNAATIRP